MIYEKQINGSIIALTKEGEYYLCESNFDLLYTLPFQDLKHKFSKYYIAKRNGKWALIDSQGNTYSDFIYEKIVWFESDLFLCYNAEGWILINSKSKNVLGENFQKLISLKNGIAIFQHNNEYVFVNGYEQILNRVKFTNVNASFNGADMALIENEEGKIGWLKKNGDCIVCPPTSKLPNHIFKYCRIKVFLNHLSPHLTKSVNSFPFEPRRSDPLPLSVNTYRY